MRIQKMLKEAYNSTKIFCVTIVLANLILLLQLNAFEFLPLGDWIPHIYNSRIIKDLLFSPASGITGFYEMYFSHFTNMTDHFIMAALMTFLPATVASQVVIGLMVLIMQFGLYKLLKSLSVNVWWTFLIIPFIFNSLFIGGMINYNIAIGLLFLLLAAWIKYFEKPKSKWRIVVLLILPALIYHTHIFIYGISGLFIGIYILTALLKQSEKGIRSFLRIKNLAQTIILFTASNLFPAVIFLTYFFSKTSVTTAISASNFSFQPLLNLFSMRILVGYSGAAEGHSLNLLYFSIGIIAIVSILILLIPRIRKAQQVEEGTSYPHILMISLLIMAGIFMVGLFFIPAKVMGAGACLDKRIELLLQITIILIFILQVNRFKYGHFLFLLVIPLSISTILHVSVLDRFWSRDSYPVAHHLMEMSDDWPELSTVMVISRDTQWYMAHISNATGIQNRVVCYENYEAESGHFITARVAGNPLADIDRNSRFFGHNEIDWGLVIPDNEPDYIIMLQKENPIVIPEALYQRYDTISSEAVGEFRVIGLKQNP